MRMFSFPPSVTIAHLLTRLHCTLCGKDVELEQSLFNLAHTLRR